MHIDDSFSIDIDGDDAAIGRVITAASTTLLSVPKQSGRFDATILSGATETGNLTIDFPSFFDPLRLGRLAITTSIQSTASSIQGMSVNIYEVATNRFRCRIKTSDGTAVPADTDLVLMWQAEIKEI